MEELTLEIVLAISGCIALLIGLFGGGVKAKEITIRWADIGINGNSGRLKELWTKQEFKLEKPEYSATIPGHGVLLLRHEK